MFINAPTSPVETAVREAYAAGVAGDVDKARAAALRALALDPDYLEAWFVLGNTALAASVFGEAVSAFSEGARRAPAGSPTHAQFITLRARALIFDGRMAEGIADVHSVMPGIQEPAGLITAATLLAQAGLESEALPLFERAVQLDPTSAHGWYGLGGCRQIFGDLKGAEEAYDTSVLCGQRSGNPEPLAHMYLARLRRWTADHNHITRLETTQCRNSLDAACVAYALFKEYDDIGDRDAAWDALQHGSMIGGSIVPWSLAEEQALAAAWRDNFPLARYASSDTRPRPGPKRIFIVGLPRSGTTLVDRILTAHSQVQSLGELKTFAVSVKINSQSRTAPLLDTDTVEAAAQVDPLLFAEWYNRETAYLHDGSTYTIDKLPSNHEYVGLIRLAFPDAAIIHVRREPMDSLFGAYKILFSRAYPWSYTQAHLAQHYEEYRKIMEAWRIRLDLSGRPLIEVSLEAIIHDPETEIRRLLDLCGLEFEPACLNPHEASGAVSTASSAQVRSPINAEGVGAWRRYSDRLEPLRSRLEAIGLVDHDGKDIRKI